ncbi:MAG TPA: hypothetical protein VNP04_21530 [Alphaproteobacteria bacterium]|nr:hypothetical protein [Alphaproteobacteria bacterium]
MATLAELHTILVRGDAQRQDLFNKVVAAVIKQAEAIRVEASTTANHANRLLWAKAAFHEPQAKAEEMWAALLAANAGATVTQILGASDTTIETAVANAVDIFATGA